MNGTYQAVLKGKNIVGVMIFGTTDSPEKNKSGNDQRIVYTGSNNWTFTALYDLTGNEGRFAMFVNGSVVAGTASGSADMKGRKLTAVLEGSRNRGNQIITRNTTTIATGGTSGLVQTSNYLFKDVIYVAGSFDAKFSSTYPVLSFKGRGDLDVNDPTGIEEVTVDSKTNAVGSGAQQTVTTTKIVPKIDTTTLRLNVYGVKTSTSLPYFGSALTVEAPSVTPYP